MAIVIVKYVMKGQGDMAEVSEIKPQKERWSLIDSMISEMINAQVHTNARSPQPASAIKYKEGLNLEITIP